MAKRRPRRARARHGAGGGARRPVRTLIGIADYTPEDWQRIITTSAAPSEEDDTYEEWLEARDHVLAVLTAHGVVAHLVAVRAEALFAWLQAQGLPNLSKHRAAYAGQLIASGGAAP